MKILLSAAAALCLAGCNTYQPVSSAAEHGLRKDLKAVCEVTNFREINTEKTEAAGGPAAVVHFESDVRWLTLEEALSKGGAAGSAQDYLAKLEYAAAKLGGVPKAGRSAAIKGAILLSKTDTGWIYKGLASE
jgi:hypothetical protein